MGIISRGKRLWLTGGTLAGLTVGFLLGALAHARDDDAIRSVAGLLAPIGTLWLNSLRMTIVPLVAAQMVAALTHKSGLSAARVGTSGLATIVGLLVAAGIAALAVAPLLLQILPWEAAALDAFRAAGPGYAASPSAPPPARDPLANLVPANPLRAAVQDDLLGVMIFALAFGIAVRRMPSERRGLVAEGSQIVADAMMTIIGWVMWLMPAAAFAFALSVGASGGAGGARIFVSFIAGSSTLLLLFMLLLYPIGAFGARMSIRRFASVVLPVQLVAFSTRSSRAALPLTMECARSGLRLRPEVSGLAVPAIVSTLRLSNMVSPAFELLFLANVYGIELSALQVLWFVSAMFVLSFSSPGLPTAASMRAAPVYVAAGIPLEAYLVADALDGIPDMFKTVLNVTAHLTAAAVINRQIDVTAGARPAGATKLPSVEASPV